MRVSHTSEELTVPRWDSSRQDSRHWRALPGNVRLMRRDSESLSSSRIATVSDVTDHLLFVASG